MINITKEERERAKRDPGFLLEVLTDELYSVRDALEGLPLDKIQKFQGKAEMLRDIIKVLE